MSAGLGTSFPFGSGSRKWRCRFFHKPSLSCCFQLGGRREDAITITGIEGEPILSSTSAPYPRFSSSVANSFEPAPRSCKPHFSAVENHPCVQWCAYDYVSNSIPTTDSERPLDWAMEDWCEILVYGHTRGGGSPRGSERCYLCLDRPDQ